MGRKKNVNDAIGAVPLCPQKHGLERRVADAPYECDACSAEIPLNGCFFGCEPCDYSICGNCYVNKASEAQEEAERKEEYGQYIIPEGQIHPDVWDICEQYSIEDRVMIALNEEMKKRHATWKQDFDKLWMEMRMAKFPGAGLLFTKVKEMRAGTFVGKLPPKPEVQRVIKKYSLDQDARDKLVDFLQKREKDGQWEKDLWETEQRLMGCKNPSMMCLTMVVKLQKGLPLPPIKHTWKDRRDDKRDDKRDGSRDREGKDTGAASSGHRGGRDGDRDDRRGGRDSDRDRDYGRKRSRSRRR